MQYLPFQLYDEYNTIHQNTLIRIKQITSTNILHKKYLNFEDIPLTEYKDYEHNINSQYKDELVHHFIDSPIESFIISGGTTGTPKLSIFTEIMSRSIEPFALYFLKYKQQFVTQLKWKSLRLLYSDPNSVQRTLNNTRIGSLTTVVLDNSPNAFKTSPLGIKGHHAKTIDEFFNNILNISHKETIVEWNAAFPYIALRLCQYTEQVLGKQCKEVWNQLQLITTVTGGPFQFYTDKLKDFFPNIVFIDLGICSTEGYYFAIHLGQSRYILNPYSCYYEFLDKDNILYSIDQIKLGNEYEIVYSTLNGYIRYNTKDLFRLIDFYNDIPIFTFIGRGSYLNIVQEKISESVLKQVLEPFFIDTPLCYFMVSSIMIPIAHYEFILVVNQDLTNVSHIEQSLDRSLREQNIVYNWARDKHTLSCPIVHYCLFSTFSNYIQQMSEVNLQFKIPHILVESKFIDLKNNLCYIGRGQNC
jgi:hypothetical protein